MTPFRIFIGYDEREVIAYHVLSHSILTRASCPVSIAPLRRENLSHILTRPRGPLDSTDFAISRFLVPYLCDYEGYALFIDCDMLCLDDIAELDMLGMANMVLNDWDVACVKHDYIPRKRNKFLDQKQTTYTRKNWSSVMLFNNAECKSLTLPYVNKAAGLLLHQFEWAKRIGSLPPRWNNLIGETCELPIKDSAMLHYTRGGPWFKDCDQISDTAELWKRELRRVTGSAIRNK